MRSTFSGVPSEGITLHRDDGQAVSLILHALPPGYRQLVMNEFQPPRLYVNGVPGPVDPGGEDLYWHRVGWILLAKALEPSGELTTARTAYPAGSKGWQQFADDVSAEFVAGGFTDDEVQTLHATAARAGKARLGSSDSGKSASPSGE